MRNNSEPTASTSTQSSRAESESTSCCVWLERLQKMSNNVQIDAELSQVLQQYLRQLHEQDSFIQNDIFNINFAEAGLFIERTAQLFGKKVDHFWELVFDYQKRLVESVTSDETQSAEMEQLEERKQKFKRRRKCKQDETQVTQLVNQYSFGIPDDMDYVNKNYDQVNMLKQWRILDGEVGENNCTTDATASANTFNTSRNSSYLLPVTAIYAQDEEYVGRYDQVQSSSIIDDIFHLETCDNLTCRDKQLITDLRLDCYVLNDYLLEHPDENCRSAECVEYMSSYAESRNRQGDVTRESYVQLERLPMTTVQDKLRRMSAVDSLLDSNFDEDVIASSPQTIMMNNDESIMHEVTFDDDLEPVQIENRTKSCGQDSAFFEMDDLPESPRNQAVVTPQEASIPPPSTPVFVGSQIIPKPRAAKRPLPKDDDEREVFKKPKCPSKKRIKLTKRFLKALAGRMTVSYRVFETFYRREYRPSENEGVVPPMEPETEEKSDDEADDDDDDNNNRMSPSTLPNISLTDHTYSETGGDENRTDFEAEESPEIDGNHEELQVTPTDLNSLSVDQELLEASRRNLQEWRNFIRPMLRSMDKRDDFDMRAYASKILDPVEVHETKSFKDIVAGKDASEVARYFATTLQLANTNNLKIRGVRHGHVSNETLAVRVLDKTQNYHLFDDYQAPSEETFFERLDRAKRTNEAAHSTPNTEQNPRKRFRPTPGTSRRLY